jgi:uncharacterized protein DUF3987/Toprim domain-containing protein
MTVALNSKIRLPIGIPTTVDGKRFRHIWAYKREDGEICGHAARYDSEDGSKVVIPFFQLENGCWGTGRPKENLPLFGLHLLSGEGAAPRTAYVVEGEKCAAALQSLGLLGVTSIGGTNAAKQTDWSPLARAERVVIIPDNDEAGEKYAATVLEILAQLDNAPELAIVHLSGLGQGEDVVDWLKARIPDWDGFADIPGGRTPDIREALRSALDQCSVLVDLAAKVPELTSPVRLCPEPSPAEPFPVEALGEVLGGATRAIHEATQAPEALCAQSVLGAAALAVQAQVDVEIDGRVSPTSEFFLTVGESGERKTTVDMFALCPHREFQGISRARYEKQHLLYEQELEEYELAHAAVKVTGDERSGGNKELSEADLEALEARPQPPLQPLLVTDDVTIEGVQKHLQFGWPSIGIFTDEGAKVAGGHAMTPENMLKTVAHLSSFWDGQETSRVRGGDGLSTLFGRRVSLHLMMQPAVAALVLENALLKDQGFLSRCLVSWPSSTVGIRLYREKNITKDIHFIRYSERLRTILELSLPTQNGRANELVPTPWTLSPEAKQLWVAFHDEVEGKMAPDGELALVKGFANKAPEHAARLACILGYVENDKSKEVTKRAVEAGIRLSRYYLGEALRLHERESVAEELRKAEKLLQWMKNRSESEFKPTFIYQFGPKELRSKSDLNPVLNVLEEYGRIEKVGNGKQRVYKLLGSVS